MTGSIVSPELRVRIRGAATPIAVALGRLGLTPNALTLIGFLGTCVAAFAAAQQAWLAAGVLVLLFGIFDLFDGTLARATDKVTTFGAFLDSTFDRAGEAIVYIGIAGGAIAGRFETGAVLAAAAMAAAFLVSYVRAKAESLGYAPGSGLAAVGVAPREVRLAILTITLLVVGISGPLAESAPTDIVHNCSPAVSPTGGIPCPDMSPLITPAGLLAFGLGLIVLLATITVIQRILVVRAQAKEG